MYSSHIISFETAEQAREFRDRASLDTGIFTVQEPGMANANADEIILSSMAALDTNQVAALEAEAAAYGGSVTANMRAGA